MRLFDAILDMMGSTLNDACADAPCGDFNPATGLPMINGTAGMDIAGNPYGTNLGDSADQALDSTFGDTSSGSIDSFGFDSGFDDSYDSSFDSFGSGDW